MTNEPATSERRNLADADLTRAVEASFDGTPDARLREVLQALTRHLHAFAGEVELTEDEWFAAIGFLTRTGQMCNDKRQEFVLPSDVMGLSMLVIGINHRHPTGATESTVFGPFFVEGSPAFENGDDLANGAPGVPATSAGRCARSTATRSPARSSRSGRPTRTASTTCSTQTSTRPAARPPQRRRRGALLVLVGHPEAYPIPTDGPVGQLLAATNRSPMRPAHIHFMVKVPGYQALITHVFDESDQYLDTDAVFGVRSSLLATFEHHEGGTAPDGREMSGAWASTEFDLILAPS